MRAYPDFQPHLHGRLPWRMRLRLLFVRKMVSYDFATGHAIVVKWLDGRMYVVDEQPKLVNARPRGWRMLNPWAWREARLARNVMNWVLFKNGSMLFGRAAQPGQEFKGTGNDFVMCDAPEDDER